MNGDGNANGVYLSAAGYWAGDGIWVKTLNGSGSDNIRINYVVVRLQYSVSQHEDWVAARFKFGVDKITFWQNANGNFEIWFNTLKDNICLTFSRDMVGVYDANTRTGKSVHLSQHSVSQCKPQYKIYAGSRVINATQSWGTLFTKDEFISSFGRGFDASRDSISVMNGDGEANNITVFGISYYPQDGKLVVSLSANGSGAFRINYIVVLAEQTLLAYAYKKSCAS